MKNIVLAHYCAFVVSFCFVSVNVSGQENPESESGDIELIISDFCEDMSEEECTEFMELIDEYSSHPLDINSISRDDIGRLPFLDAGLVEAIESYRYLNGNFKSLSELQLLRGLDFNSRKLLSLTVYPGAGKHGESHHTSFREMVKYGHCNLLTKNDIPFYRRAGDAKYSGNPVHSDMRFSFKYSDILNIGFSMDKDPGEPYLDKNMPWVDFLSAYVSISGFLGTDRIVLGNLKAGFGQGLVVNTGFGMGKSMAANVSERELTGFKPHSSTSESGFFSGIGTAAHFGNVHLSAMLSKTARDAAIDEDGDVTSWKQDGYHRSATERSKKANTSETAAIFHVNWHKDGIDIGSTFMTEYFDRIVNKYGQDRFWNAGIDYSIHRSRYSFCGETAVCDSWNLATLNTLKVKLGTTISLTLIYRGYGERFFSQYASAFSEGDVGNERGIYVGCATRFHGIECTSYIDLFRFPGPRYGVSSSSGGLDACVDMKRAVRGSSNEVSMKYRFKMKGKDSKVLSSVENECIGRMRLRLDHTCSPSFSLLTQLDAVHYYFPDDGMKFGGAFSSSVSVKPDGGKNRFSGSVSFSFFCTEDYDTSVSVYEKGLLYSFNFITLYGLGMRPSAVLKMNITDRISLSIKAGGTIFLDRDCIGSSLQKIESNHKEDISLQLRAKF